jgi:anti-sigma B factor antagonist
MHPEHQGVSVDGKAASDATLHGARDAVRYPSRVPLESARSQPHQGHWTGAPGPVDGRRQPIVAGQLAVRWERQDGTLLMWLTGELDQATVTLVDRELDAQAIGMMHLVIDLTGLEFIDSAGLDALVGIHWRACKRGDRLSFRHGRQGAQRPIELTRTVRLRSRFAARMAGVSDEADPYFALAMACVNVDHSWSGDRPEAA